MISIIIPTLNRPKKIIGLIERLNLIILNEEVVFVDDSFVSQEIEIKNKAKFNFSYIHRRKKLGVCSARNRGAKDSKGEYLIFFDDDDDFTSDWLADFRSAIITYPDLIQCQMKFVSEEGVEEVINNRKEDWKLVIPGCWMIKKSIFFEIGGFDTELKFAENTELFFRLSPLNLKKKYIPKVNFIYNQSIDGGSQNLINMNDSIKLILEKHNGYLSIGDKRNYHQILGVNYLRFQNFADAKRHLMVAFLITPLNLKTFIRLLISYVPPIAKILYPFKFK